MIGMESMCVNTLIHQQMQTIMGDTINHLWLKIVNYLNQMHLIGSVFISEMYKWNVTVQIPLKLWTGKHHRKDLPW